MIAALTLLLALQPAAPVPAPAAEGGAAAEVLKSLEGKWTGKGHDDTETAWEFKGDTLKVKLGDHEFSSKVELDPEAKPHPSFDFKITLPAEFEGKTALAIYELKGNKLKVCVSMPDNPNRPTVFQSQEGEAFLYELEKAEKKG